MSGNRFRTLNLKGTVNIFSPKRLIKKFFHSCMSLKSIFRVKPIIMQLSKLSMNLIVYRIMDDINVERSHLTSLRTSKRNPYYDVIISKVSITPSFCQT